MKEAIVVLMMEDGYLGLKRLATLLFKAMDTVFMVMVEVDIGIIPDPLPPIIQVILVDFWVFLFVVMREV